MQCRSRRARAGRGGFATNAIGASIGANPVRKRILHLAADPVTVAELADRPGVPHTRLYYHVNLLVQNGFLAQVDRRKSGARIEKTYRRSSSDLRLGPNVAETIGDRRKAADAAAALLFDQARVEAADVIERVFGGEHRQPRSGGVW